jgi:energy-coupling factor transporter ATP-binding protein EcfA2
MTADAVLRVQGLGVEFQTRRGIAHVLDDVSFDLARGGTLGLVGESGCGKSITALAAMRLIPQPPGRITAGQVWLDGRELLALPEREMRDPRQPHLDDLPGADDLAEPRVHGGRPDRRGGARAPGAVAPRGAVRAAEMLRRSASRCRRAA